MTSSIISCTQTEGEKQSVTVPALRYACISTTLRTTKILQESRMLFVLEKSASDEVNDIREGDSFLAGFEPEDCFCKN